MMSKRQAAFRADYRTKIGKLYSGPVHVFVIYAIGFAAIWYFARHIQNTVWTDWLIVPLAFTGANIFEWWIHRYVMHRPVKGFMGIYKRHTLAHHQFFTEEEPTFDSTKDYRITFFPPYALATFICMTIVPAWITAQIWSANAAWLLMCTTTAIYLNYELFHMCCHVKNDWLVKHLPFINTIRRHHISHHNTSIMMEKNFNLTYPIADWLFGTSDLDRGLVGHVFNGYDTRFKKRNLRKARMTVDDPSAGVVRA
jgi:hypothetical protein